MFHPGKQEKMATELTFCLFLSPVGPYWVSNWRIAFAGIGKYMALYFCPDKRLVWFRGKVMGQLLRFI